MNRFKVLTPLLLFIVVALPLGYAVYITLRSQDFCFIGNYWQNAMASLLATVIGVGAGVPIGLWVNRRIQQEAEKVRLSEELRQAEKQKHRVLSLTLEELEGNISPLEQLVEGKITKFYLNVARWRALSGGGELKWIANVEVLSRVAQVYEDVEAVNTLVNKWVSVAVSRTGLGDDTGEVSAAVIKNLAVAAGEDALSSMKAAIDAIKIELAASPS